jgi:diaminopimelate epimerase
MNLPFTKMSGAGNDFVLIDNRQLRLPLERAHVAALCHRRFGIGADGLLAVEAGRDGADFAMRYFNADGGEAEMCGNGARCFARFVRPLLPSGPASESVRFATMAGIIQARYLGDEVEIALTPPTGFDLSRALTLPRGPRLVHSVNTGVPHAVVFVENVEHIALPEAGPEIRYHEAFQPKGTNVNFVQIVGPGRIRVRTYERGVEGETLACGTGVAASAILAHLVHGIAGPVIVRVQGGADLRVAWHGDGAEIRHVTLQGPATVTFTGEVPYPPASF